MTRCLGAAFRAKQLIKFSGPLWERANDEQQKENVFHETCHIIVALKYGFGLRAHGSEWGACMEACGYEPIRCHKVDRTGLCKKYVKYEVKCKCTDSIWVGHAKAAHIRKFSYSCMKCNSHVSFTGRKFYPKTLKVV